MPRFPFLRRRKPATRHRGVLEIVVLEGDDTGSAFTLDGEVIDVGRGSPRLGEIRLADPTVSTKQAVIFLTPEGAVLKHVQGAANATLVNGKEIRRCPLSPGDRIRFGRVELEVRSHEGHSLGGLTEIITESRQTEGHTNTEPSGPADTTQATEPTQPVAPADQTVHIQVSAGSGGDTTEIRRNDGRWGRLEVVSGLGAAVGSSIELVGEKVAIGRNPASDVVVPEQGVSRNHAELVLTDGGVVLRHVSQTNETFVNGMPVTSSEVLQGGEEIQLADRVVFRLELGSVEPGLRTLVEAKVRRDTEIEREFGVDGAFLDIDVVDSYGLKANAERPEHIILSFERFRAFARRVIEEFDGKVLNSNGDELMCFFESPHQAVRSASAVIQRLSTFNAEENLLPGPFRVRQGVHSGNCLVDLRRGVAYSDVLDVAGHLQKHADTDGLLISEATLQALPEGLPFEAREPLPREGIPTHRLAAPLD